MARVMVVLADEDCVMVADHDHVLAGFYLREHDKAGSIMDEFYLIDGMNLTRQDISGIVECLRVRSGVA